ncbi:hypothetical protein Ancab_033757 [Ancistrocladus abbreviatus]
MATINSLILSVKVKLITNGILFIAMLLTLSLPKLLNFAASEFPNLWSSFRSWLRPPYLYVIINCIIIAIAASSLFHNNHHKHDDSDHVHHPASAEVNHAAKVTSSLEVIPAADVDQVRGGDANRFGVDYDDALPVKDVEVVASHVATTTSQVSEASVEEVDYEDVKIGESDEHNCGAYDDGDDAGVMSPRSTWTPPPPSPPVIRDSSEVLSEHLWLTVEKPPVTATERFVHRRRAVRTVPEGRKALRSTKPKRHETLESTWKAITEGRHMPLTRHPNKSDTWENHSREITSSDSSPEQLVKKSATFKERTNCSVPPPPSSPRLKKEPSLSQDELNRRAEAFINKFNEDMRLQRQQSLQQFMEMINRGA